jgi:hypothetical protein
MMPAPLRPLLLVVAAIVLWTTATACSSAPSARETCGNGLDDDGNGLRDCGDPDCWGQRDCVPGPCERCGEPCAAQAQCLSQGFSYDAPLPWCASGRCEQRNVAVELDFRFDTSAWTSVTSPGSLVLRILSRRAVDGSPVTCAEVESVAGRSSGEAGRIEDSGRFQALGFDVRKRTGSSTFAPTFFVNLVKVGTGAGYLIWVETWGGPPDPSTKLPQGTRFSATCYDAAELTAPIGVEDACPPPGSDAGRCRRFDLVLPAP